ncbi:MAG: hypothetical protein A2078_13685 [Nitrospirae bacterium GWC2_57_9]|nr:MAG: hypothetical protein A2078_13685 [Nitrospirae bacterium GWC2_57_9]
MLRLQFEVFNLPEKLTIGGQAVLEGVMMRSPRAFTVAVRKGGKPEAGIAIYKQELRPLSERFPVLKKKIIRGSAALFEAMWLGMRALNFSANEALPEEDGKKEEISPMAMAGTMLLAVAFAIGLFLVLPLLLTNLLGTKYAMVGANSLLFNLTDGAFRVVLFLGYVSGISFMKDIRRVFEYHGAEHKAIAAFEAGGSLTVQNARAYSRIHPRCGTSFLLTVIALSILLFSLIPGSWPIWAKGLSRLVLLPLIAGLGYEFIKYSAKHCANPVVKGLMQPGLWLQRLTTREPSDDQIEVAIRALEEAVAMEPR